MSEVYKFEVGQLVCHVTYEDTPAARMVVVDRSTVPADGPRYFLRWLDAQLAVAEGWFREFELRPAPPARPATGWRS